MVWLKTQDNSKKVSTGESMSFSVRRIGSSKTMSSGSEALVILLRSLGSLTLQFYFGLGKIIFNAGQYQRLGWKSIGEQSAQIIPCGTDSESLTQTGEVVFLKSAKHFMQVKNGSLYVALCGLEITQLVNVVGLFMMMTRAYRFTFITLHPLQVENFGQRSQIFCSFVNPVTNGFIQEGM
jgi:hypothetical protein